ncbi:hypothetical protein ADUPG1_014254 [Aduncisulcus paluster]|uniref:Uncharacterized protein n=1 Tax=Aduncisulcus paluster TaxID=2918883 RepID=A0ABQ5KBD0_9EUKA|nr:hypothetical protein ADUPG1_014254 [Aduncisulcus paluster]
MPIITVTKASTNLFPFVLRDGSGNDIMGVGQTTTEISSGGLYSYSFECNIGRTLYPVSCSTPDRYGLIFSVPALSGTFTFSTMDFDVCSSEVVLDAIVDDPTNSVIEYYYYVTSFTSTPLATFIMCYDADGAISAVSSAVFLGRELSFLSGSLSTTYYVSSDSDDVSSADAKVYATEDASNSEIFEILKTQNASFSVITGTLGSATTSYYNDSFTFDYSSQLEGKNVDQDITCGVYLQDDSVATLYSLDTTTTAYQTFSTQSITYASCENPSKVLQNASGICEACAVATLADNGSCVNCDIYELCDSSDSYNYWSGQDYYVSTMVYDAVSGDITDMTKESVEFKYEIFDTSGTALTELTVNEEFYIVLTVNNSNINPTINSGRSMDVRINLNTTESLIDVDSTSVEDYRAYITISLSSVSDGNGGNILQSSTSSPQILRVKDLYESGKTLPLSVATTSGGPLTITDPSVTYYNIVGPSTILITGESSSTISQPSTTATVSTYLKFNFQPSNDFDIDIVCTDSSITGATCTDDGTSQSFQCDYSFASDATTDESILPKNPTCTLEYQEVGTLTTDTVQWDSSTSNTGDYDILLYSVTFTCADTNSYKFSVPSATTQRCVSESTVTASNYLVIDSTNLPADDDVSPTLHVLFPLGIPQNTNFISMTITISCKDSSSNEVISDTQTVTHDTSTDYRDISFSLDPYVFTSGQTISELTCTAYINSDSTHLIHTDGTGNPDMSFTLDPSILYCSHDLSNYCVKFLDTVASTHLCLAATDIYTALTINGSVYEGDLSIILPEEGVGGTDYTLDLELNGNDLQVDDSDIASITLSIDCASDATLDCNSVSSPSDGDSVGSFTSSGSFAEVLSLTFVPNDVQPIDRAVLSFFVLFEDTASTTYGLQPLDITDALLQDTASTTYGLQPLDITDALLQVPLIRPILIEFDSQTVTYDMTTTPTIVLTLDYMPRPVSQVEVQYVCDLPEVTFSSFTFSPDQVYTTAQMTLSVDSSSLNLCGDVVMECWPDFLTLDDTIYREGVKVLSDSIVTVTLQYDVSVSCPTLEYAYARMNSQLYDYCTLSPVSSPSCTNSEALPILITLAEVQASGVDDIVNWVDPNINTITPYAMALADTTNIDVQSSQISSDMNSEFVIYLDPSSELNVSGAVIDRSVELELTFAVVGDCVSIDVTPTPVGGIVESNWSFSERSDRDSRVQVLVTAESYFTSNISCGVSITFSLTGSGGGERTHVIPITNSLLTMFSYVDVDSGSGYEALVFGRTSPLQWILEEANSAVINMRYTGSITSGCDILIDSPVMSDSIDVRSTTVDCDTFIDITGGGTFTLNASTGDMETSLTLTHDTSVFSDYTLIDYDERCTISFDMTMDCPSNPSSSLTSSFSPTALMPEVQFHDTEGSSFQITSAVQSGDSEYISIISHPTIEINFSSLPAQTETSAQLSLSCTCADCAVTTLIDTIAIDVTQAVSSTGYDTSYAFDESIVSSLRKTGVSSASLMECTLTIENYGDADLIPSNLRTFDLPDLYIVHICSDGQYLSTSSVCEDCSLGEYCESGAIEPSFPQDCSYGHYSHVNQTYCDTLDASWMTISTDPSLDVYENDVLYVYGIIENTTLSSTDYSGHPDLDFYVNYTCSPASFTIPSDVLSTPLIPGSAEYVTYTFSPLSIYIGPEITCSISVTSDVPQDTALYGTVAIEYSSSSVVLHDTRVPEFTITGITEDSSGDYVELSPTSLSTSLTADFSLPLEGTLSIVCTTTSSVTWLPDVTYPSSITINSSSYSGLSIDITAAATIPSTAGEDEESTLIAECTVTPNTGITDVDSQIIEYYLLFSRTCDADLFDVDNVCRDISKLVTVSSLDTIFYEDGSRSELFPFTFESSILNDPSELILTSISGYLFCEQVSLSLVDDNGSFYILADGSGITTTEFLFMDTCVNTLQLVFPAKNVTFGGSTEYTLDLGQSTIDLEPYNTPSIVLSSDETLSVFSSSANVEITIDHRPLESFDLEWSCDCDYLTSGNTFSSTIDAVESLDEVLSLDAMSLEVDLSELISSEGDTRFKSFICQANVSETASSPAFDSNELTMDVLFRCEKGTEANDQQICSIIPFYMTIYFPLCISLTLFILLVSCLGLYVGLKKRKIRKEKEAERMQTQSMVMNFVQQA